MILLGLQKFSSVQDLKWAVLNFLKFPFPLRNDSHKLISLSRRLPWVLKIYLPIRRMNSVPENHTPCLSPSEITFGNQHNFKAIIFQLKINKLTKKEKLSQDVLGWKYYTNINHKLIISNPRDNYWKFALN